MAAEMPPGSPSTGPFPGPMPVWRPPGTGADPASPPPYSGPTWRPAYRPSNANPGGPLPAVRWGIPDALWVWLAGIAGAVVLASVAALARGDLADPADDPVVFAGSVAGNYVAMLVLLVALSRWKGRGSLAADFGLRLHLRDWWFVPLGFGLQIGVNIVSYPISELAARDEAPQDIVRRLQESGGLELAVIVVSAALAAPVIEELLFRGILLRGLLRRMPPAAAVGASALVFAGVHLMDPGALPVLPGLLVVGLVNGVLAVRSGDLSRPILCHAGFNLLVVLVALSGGG